MREMRRKDRILSEAETWDIINNGKYGVLCLNGADDYPYGVPMHYIVHEGKLYMHGTAAGGHKHDNIVENPKASFSIIEMDDDIKGRSAILFGTVNIVPEKREAVLNKVVERFIPEFAWEQAKAGIPYAKENICAYELNIEHLSGKWIDKPEGN